ncbi:MAG: asparagine synthase-related protein [Blastocatellia bacterium]
MRTTDEAADEHQPFSFDDLVWIVADARIDGREDLVRTLNATGRDASLQRPDVELILHAYQVWGEACVEHLLGDFAFAIWDETKLRLFCARDHFGVKPFFYAQLGDCLVFSNTLNTVRLHPAVSDELNEQTIADFLLTGYNYENAATVFASILRLPAANTLVCTMNSLRMCNYWSLPVDGYIRYKRSGEYVEHFNELLYKAVADRIRNDCVAVSMSGGLDSTMIATATNNLLSADGQSNKLQAFTLVYDHLIPDRERHYSNLAAQSLGIPIHFLPLDNYGLYERWDRPELQASEPNDFPFSAFVFDYLSGMARHSRVRLTGEGGDSLLCPSESYFTRLLKNGRVDLLARYIGRHLWLHGQIPPLGFRSVVKRWLGRQQTWQWQYPVWFNQDFARQLNLRARLQQLEGEPPSIHPTRPEAYNQLNNGYWASYFEKWDPGMTRVPIEGRHPLFDPRLVEYLLAIPPIPWCVNKELFRVSMQGWLPDEIRYRKKSPLAGNAVYELLQQKGNEWVDNFSPTPMLEKFVDRRAIPKLVGEQDVNQLWLNIRPLGLNMWLQNFKLGDFNSN